ncbi:hypothetical protein GCM10009559_34720 [Pseudonocardia zijingensis]|uniref:P-type ATPase A domain-containing protein n=1 Tax=Pseudonocardia zijingensis TaxID=153376 RepID=A0ABN1QAL1_9PSEU
MAADLRVVEARGLRADESALTGESVPVDKDHAPVDPAAELAERRSMLHGGTVVTSEAAEAVVVETGDRTALGRVSGLVGGVEVTQTPLTRSIGRLGAAVTKVIGVVAVVLLVVALLRGYPVADAVLAAITLAVAAIPEGLPAIVTIALAVGVQRMARRRAVVRELPAVETLGSTSVICTDKTGTLTCNEMVVRRAWVPGGAEAEFDGVGYAPGGGYGCAGRRRRTPVPRSESCCAPRRWPTSRTWPAQAPNASCSATRPTGRCWWRPSARESTSPRCSATTRRGRCSRSTRSAGTWPAHLQRVR